MNTLEDLDILRAVAAPVEFRDAPAEGDGRIGTMVGHSTVFNRWYEIDSWIEGQFMERVAPGAAVDTIRDNPDVKVLFNHGRDMSIGNKVLGVHEALREDQVGVYYEVPLLDTSYNRDLLPGLKAGAYGSSFSFRVSADSWDDEPVPSDHNPKGIPERTITKFRLFEHGPVTFPANPEADSGVRSTTDDFYRAALAPDAFEAMAERARTLRTPTPSGTEGVPGEDASNPTDYGHANAVRFLQRTPLR